MSILDNSAAAGSAVLDPIAATIKNPFSTTVPNNGERGQDFPEGFEITEYVDGKKFGYLQLIGNLMPMQPFEWDLEQHLTKDYYPGNKEAVVHLMGVRHGEITIHGRFKDKRYQDPAYYGVSYQFCKALEEICARGNILKFGMEGAGGSFIRWGFLEKPKFKMNKLSWIDYELTFFVVSDSQPVFDFFAEPEKQAPDLANANLINGALNFQATYSAIPTSMPSSIADKMNQLTSGLAKNINLVTNFVGTIISTGQDIAAASHRALGLIKNARNTIKSMGRQIDNVAHDFTHMTFSALPAAQKVPAAFKNISFLHEASAALGPISKYLQQMQTQFEAIARSIPVARHRVIGNETLQNISIKHYGVSDHWGKIQDHNKLSSTQLTKGSILEIPHL